MKKPVLLFIAAALSFAASAQTTIYEADCLDSTLAIVYTSPTSNQFCTSDSVIYTLASYSDVEGVYGDGIWQGNDGYEFNSGIAVEGLNQINISFFHECPEAQIFRTEASKPTIYNSTVTDFILIEDCDAPEVLGCTDEGANNYNVDANRENGSCTYDEEGGQYYASITSDETLTSDDIHAQLIDIDLDGTILTTTWVLILPGSSHSVVTTYYLTSTVGTVQLDLNLTVDAPSLKESAKPSTQNFTLTKGVDLGKITALTNEVQKNGISVFPTIADNQLNINTDKPIESVEVLDINGNNVLTATSNVINTSSLNTGNYIVKVSAEGTTYTACFIKK